jgi:signal transduction histidine kinase
MADDDACSRAAARSHCVSRRDSNVAGIPDGSPCARDAPKPAESTNTALAILAHEIRGRLNGLTILAESMRYRARDRSHGLSHDWILERLERQAGHLERLQKVVDMVLFAYRDVCGELTPARERADLGDIVGEAIAVECEALTLAHCACVVEANEHLVGFWDRCQLELAIANLVNNAAKYGAGNPVEIRVFKHGRTACVSVSDRGVGIRPEEIPHLFRRFTRLESGAGSSGIGLGLWFAKSVALAHGGDLNASSRADGGACFTLVLPFGGDATGRVRRTERHADTCSPYLRL